MAGGWGSVPAMKPRKCGQYSVSEGMLKYKI
jgi:hypothetical protein